MGFKKLAKEFQLSQGRFSQLTIQAPVPVLIKEYFPADNLVTVQLSSSSNPYLDRASIGDTKFPILAPVDATIGYGIKPGMRALLFYPGWQIKRGWIVLAHTQGTEHSVTYTPIRHSWAI